MSTPKDEEVFFPEYEISRLMDERFKTDGFLLFKLPASSACSLERSFKRHHRLDDLAQKNGAISTIIYWYNVFVELATMLPRFILRPHAEGIREFYIINNKSISSFAITPHPNEEKCMFVRLNRGVASNTAGNRDGPTASLSGRPLP